MKNRFAAFWKKYYILIILSFVHPIVMATANYWGDIKIIDSILGHASTLYLICAMPLLHFIYGCIAYAVTKKVLIPTAIPAVIYFVYSGIYFLKGSEFDAILISTFLPIIFVVPGTLITAGFYKVTH